MERGEKGKGLAEGGDRRPGGTNKFSMLRGKGEEAGLLTKARYARESSGSRGWRSFVGATDRGEGCTEHRTLWLEGAEEEKRVNHLHFGSREVKKIVESLIVVEQVEQQQHGAAAAWSSSSMEQQQHGAAAAWSSSSVEQQQRGACRRF